jgi:hypothetical protein
MEMTSLESFYVIVNSAAVAFTLVALADALAARKEVYRLNGMAREVTADATVRREVFRLMVQFLLLALAVPAIIKPGDTPLSFPVAVLLTIPVVLLTSTMLDARTRRRVLRIIAEEAGKKGHAS